MIVVTAALMMPANRMVFVIMVVIKFMIIVTVAMAHHRDLKPARAIAHIRPTPAHRLGGEQ